MPGGSGGLPPGGGGGSVNTPLRFSHNIYINLPDSTDVEVFNAIFKAMRENLLS